jgi:hypothetical protein
MPSTGGTTARRWSSNWANSAAVGVWATSTRPGGGRLAEGGGNLAGAGAAVALAGAALEVLDVALELQEFEVLAVGGGDGEPANHVLEAGERALVAVVAAPAQRGGGARTGPAGARGSVARRAGRRSRRWWRRPRLLIARSCRSSGLAVGRRAWRAAIAYTRKLLL